MFSLILLILPVSLVHHAVDLIHEGEEQDPRLIADESLWDRIKIN